MDNNGIEDDGLIDFPHNTVLIKLDLSDNHITSIGAELLSQNNTITNLNLSNWDTQNGNTIGDLGAKALAANKTLKKLNLSKNGIGDDGVEDFRVNNTLIALNLSENSIRDIGTRALASNGHIIKLDLSRNQIGDSGAGAFECNNVIQELSLWGNNISKDVEKILWQHPTIITLQVFDFNKDQLLLHSILKPYHDRVEMIRAFSLGTFHKEGMIPSNIENWLMIPGKFTPNIFSNIFSFLGQHTPPQPRPFRGVLSDIEELKTLISNKVSEELKTLISNKVSKDVLENQILDIKNAFKRYDFDADEKIGITRAIATIANMALSSSDNPRIQREAADELHAAFMNEMPDDNQPAVVIHTTNVSKPNLMLKYKP
jgi:hypothetical protein